MKQAFNQRFLISYLGASRILCKRTDVVQIEQIISRERSRVQGGHSLGVILGERPEFCVNGQM